MPCRHGRKTYVQLLLDPTKADLLIDEQEKAGYKKLSDYLRSVLYQYIEESRPDMYRIDKSLKGLSWSEKVKRRVDGSNKKGKRAERAKALADLIISDEAGAA